MATATTKPEWNSAPLVRVSEMPRTKAAQEGLGELQKERAAIEEQIQVGRSATDVILEAEARVAEPALLLQLRRLDADIERARRALDESRQADRAELLARFDTLIRPLVARLDAGLTGLVEVNQQLATLELRRHEMTGDFLDPVAWPSLLRSAADGTRTSSLDAWRANVKARGLID